MTLRLRPARSTDAGKLGDMITQAVRANSWKPHLHSAAEDIAFAGRMIDRGWVTVAVDAGSRAVLGFVARDGAEVNALYVQTSAQGAGVGGALIAAAQAASDRLELWTFEANTGAQRFYERAGFAMAERTDGARNDENLPDIRYVWQRGAEPETDPAEEPQP